MVSTADFDAPTLFYGTPYPDGHKDVVVHFATCSNFNASPVLVLVDQVTMGIGKWKLKRITLTYAATLGVSVIPTIFPNKGMSAGDFELPAQLTTVASDQMIWDNLDIPISSGLGGSSGAPYLMWFAVTDYAATDDMVLRLIMEWWP